MQAAFSEVAVPEHVVFAKRRNVTVQGRAVVQVPDPPWPGSGPLSVPVTVAVSWITVPGVTDVPVMSSLALLRMWVSIDAWHGSKFPSVKSFSTAVIDCDERVS